MEQKQTPDTENRLVVTKRVGVGEGRTGVWDYQKLLPIGWINNKVLLLGKGTSQYPVIHDNGEKHLRKCLYLYNQVIFLHRRDWHIIVRQLFNKKYLKK